MTQGNVTLATKTKILFENLGHRILQTKGKGPIESLHL